MKIEIWIMTWHATPVLTHEKLFEHDIEFWLNFGNASGTALPSWLFKLYSIISDETL